MLDPSPIGAGDSFDSSDALLLQKKSRHQIIASLLATLASFCSGTVLGWSSTASPQLKATEDIGKLSDAELSWIASVALVGALISGFAAGFSIEKVGRKLTLILLAVPFVLGWFLVAFAVEVGMMFAGRFLTGFCAGAMCLVVPVYIAEITENNLRGAMSNCMVVSLVFGILFSYVVGAFISWKWMSFICGFLPIVYAIPMMFMPESPRYLLSVGKRSEACKSLEWFRGASSFNEIEPELKEIADTIQEHLEQASSWKDLFKKKTLKPVSICILLMVFQQFGGINAVIFFTVDIFKASGTHIDPNIAAIIIGAVQVAAVIVSTLLVDKIGRRILMFISETGMTLSLIALGVFFYLKHENNEEVPYGLGWLPLVSMIMFMITYNLGCASLPWTMMGELCPSHVKGIASAVVTSTSWFLAFVVTYSFADLKNAIGDYSVFWVFAGFSCAGSLFSLFILPETKGKSLEEIQRLFESPTPRSEQNENSA